MTQHITVLEPAWSGVIHQPINMALSRLCALASPGGHINLVGDAQQSTAIATQLAEDSRIQATVHAHHWPTWSDSAQEFPDHWSRWQAFKQLPATLLRDADLIVCSSLTQSCLNYLTWHGLAPKTFVVLHGNANSYFSWRSRNPIRRWLDFTAASERFAAAGGTLIVLEERIKEELAKQLPWMRHSLEVIPHPLVEEERKCTVDTLESPLNASGSGSRKVRIGFAGNASLAKGFREFSELAHRLEQRAPGIFEFAAVGMLPAESAHIDQSLFLRKSTPDRLSRDTFCDEFRRFDFVFQWYDESYYGLSSSGVMYDAINHEIPLLSRNIAELRILKTQGIEIGMTADSLEMLVAQLCTAQQENHLETQRTGWLQGLRTLQARHSTETSATRFRDLMARRLR